MPDRCLKCRSEHITAGRMITEGSTAYCEVTCENCGATYTELYEYTHILEGHVVYK